MKFVFPDISKIFDMESDKVQSIIVEKPELFYKLVLDVQNQIAGFDGIAVLSDDDNKILPLSSFAELHSQFVPFDINQKSLVTKLSAALEKLAVSDEYYAKTLEIVSELESHLLNMSLNLEGDIIFEKCSIGSIVKSVKPVFEDNCDGLCEKLINYMGMVRGYEKDKLFVFVNLRSYISDAECELFFNTALGHQFNILMIDCCEHLLLKNEERLIIDKDLCEIA